MSNFHKKVREVSQDVVQLLEDLVDEGLGNASFAAVIQDHQEILRGITNVSIISEAYSQTYRFFQVQERRFKKAESFTDVVLCKVMARRVHEVIIESLHETQPIEIEEK